VFPPLNASIRSFAIGLAVRVALPMETFQSYYRTMSALLFDTNKLIELCRENDVAKLGVFGSMARGESDDQSDIDLIVEFSKRKSLLALVSLERKMSAALGRKVDLLTEAAISPYLRDRIKHDLRVIYEAR
jgi:predicted nucleotidyltransferase